MNMTTLWMIKAECKDDTMNYEFSNFHGISTAFDISF